MAGSREYDRQREIEQADREYHPCTTGLHVCGIIADELGERPLTLANVVGVDERQFDILETHYALPEGEDPDCIVDLCVDGDIIRDFGIRRQSLDALIRSCNQALPASPSITSQEREA